MYLHPQRLSPLRPSRLGVLTFNVAGYMILTAPLSAMDTIAPQNFGAGNAVGDLRKITFSVMAAVLVALIRWRVPRAAAAWPRAEGRAVLFDRKAWRYFLATSVASLFSLTEWLFWEAVCFRVGALGTIPLSAYSVGYSLEPCLFMLAIGLSTALTNAGPGRGGRDVAVVVHVSAHRRHLCAAARPR
ncbi:hypothetical protein EMIHUDRAFT_207164 [Emiliania huxleyi CCMP1516]|uniref:Uncharacterized protein n=2 Tax=Emiliania huxleyi TaxID=2903 RepID=A0A0D3JKP3_EMIH1|nr:hypothetical protein EMIHUDRAFT_207164 [Emiliania huxleyi CCMP1516]EOD24078.1 hypothetical protein EMIHUDRAFT_207164 [Emiliania huxleyi CCMP1516]|eukprot:XP_005776507.1 hypothetical protein EMIHUDRAFT_207164 [Emiliania huxleyi CCMP1516]